MRDTVTGQISTFYGSGPLVVGTCSPEGGYPSQKACTYLVVGSGLMPPEQQKYLGGPWALTMRDTVTGQIQNFYRSGPMVVGTCYPEGGYP